MGRRSENVFLLTVLVGAFVLSFFSNYFDAFERAFFGFTVILGVCNVIYGEVRIKNAKKKIANVLKRFTKLKADATSVLRYKTHEGQYETEFVFRAYNQLLSIRRSEAERIDINVFCTIYKKNDFAVVVDQSGETYYSKTNYLP